MAKRTSEFRDNVIVGRRDIQSRFRVIRDRALRAREQRKHATKAESILWLSLRRRQVGGLRFRRQHPVGPYVLDFYCHEAKLAIEVDGEYHANDQQLMSDLRRQQQLEYWGIKVVRFSNDDVLENTEEVMKRILAVAAQVREA